MIMTQSFEKYRVIRLAALVCMLLVWQPIAGMSQPWVAQQAGVTANLNGVHFINKNTGWIVGAGGVILRTDAEGDAWISVESGTKDNLLALHAIDDLRAWAVGENGRILHTANGSQWTAQNSGITRTLRDVFFLDSRTGYAAGDDFTLLRTIDGGNTWGSVLTTPATNFKTLLFSDILNGWAAGDFVYRTTDGGRTWTRGIPQIGFGDGRFVVYDLNFTELNNGWVIAGRPSLSGSLYITNDGGRTFNQAFFSGAGNVLGSVYFHPDSSGWAVTDKGSFVQTADGGKNGVRQGDRKFQPLTKVNFIGDFGYAFGASGNTGPSLGFYIYRPDN